MVALHWTSPLIGEPPRPISLFDLTELRAVVDVNRVAAGLEPERWVGRTDADPTFQAGLTPVRAVHFTQLHRAIADLWEVAGLGPVPEFRAGPIVPGARRISVRDPLDVRSWIETYEGARTELAARVVWKVSSAPSVWPDWTGLAPEGPVLELWDGSGHSLFWQGEAQTWRELRRIDTAWYRTDLAVDQSGLEFAVAILTAGGARPIAETPISDDMVQTDPERGIGYVDWSPGMPALEADWQVDRDVVDRIVRIRAGDTVIGRVAYDGLGRMRKWVTVDQTFHIIGPGLSIPLGQPRTDS